MLLPTHQGGTKIAQQHMLSRSIVQFMYRAEEWTIPEAEAR
jgi:hypothetical protein